MIQRLSKLIALLMVIATTTVYSAEIYKWKDKSGNVHYGQTKPANVEVIEIDEPPPPPSLAPDVNKPFIDQIRKRAEQQSMQDSINKDKKADAEHANKTQAQCEKARKSLSTMTSFNRIRQYNPDGSVSILTGADKEARISEIQADIEAHCN